MWTTDFRSDFVLNYLAKYRNRNIYTPRNRNTKYDPYCVNIKLKNKKTTQHIDNLQVNTKFIHTLLQYIYILYAFNMYV